MAGALTIGGLEIQAGDVVKMLEGNQLAASQLQAIILAREKAALEAKVAELTNGKEEAKAGKKS